VTIDAFALLAVILNEPNNARYKMAMLGAGYQEPLLMPESAWFECCMKVGRHADPRMEARLDELIGQLGIDLVGLEVKHFRLASGDPFLFKGNDFNHTDLEPALKD
jgi:uncharacterized protein with PIN domain